MRVKKQAGILVALAVVLAGVLAGCSADKGNEGTKAAADGSASGGNTSKEITLKVGAAAVPHAEILEFIKPKLKEEGIILEIVTLDDEGQLNPALQEKQIDANYFQHVPYLDSIKEEKGYDFAVTAKVHVEPIGFYSEKLKSKEELPDGAKIGIPNNPSNEYRALVLLQQQGLLKLKDGLTTYEATPKDIAENPHKFEFVEADAATLPRALPDLDGAVINTNVVLESGIDPESALFREDANSPYANVIAVRSGDENREEIKKLDEALTSPEVKTFIQDKYGVAVVPAF
ncbi:MetQ/NlpA family ABC transporter substrate-binding protein [Paenibacillus sp. S150]|uniref:MetQ/NlpA family ABC transporter substrate-binding protein n=1 Tax=Paenibacillus sp. S150 TaxID=2749826 RepID=UPI001C576D2A|nr:MetQ/NlpA family ABC transporter substrate-binding protein [Paenibacillus sp. S150]MBW4082143.1 methionine ABC transporter substrate-binding protein [Paenibacillus sp. S150]